MMPNAEGWINYKKKKNGPKAKELTDEKLLKQFNYCCQVCNFKSRNHLSVLTPDLLSKKINQPVVVCDMCLHGFFIGGRDVPGRLIAMPELSQKELINFVRALFVKMKSKGQIKIKSGEMFRHIFKRHEWVENNCGKGTSNPEDFGQAMIDASLTDVRPGQGILKHIRYLPALSEVEASVLYWQKNYYKVI
jgi:hypothetical protein